MKKSSSLLLTIIWVFAIQNLTHSQGFNSIHSGDGINVIAVGADQIFRSVDGGVTWGLSQVASANFTSVFTLGSRIWITNAANGTVYTSTNSGITFSSYNTGMTDLAYVYFADTNTGWVSGNPGIYKTTNGGINWNAEVVPSSGKYNSVRFANLTSGVACSSLGTILYTTNGGTNWVSAVNPLPGRKLLSADIKGTNSVITGADGFVLMSVNSGINWTLQDFKIATKSEVRSVTMLDANTFYLGGGGGFIKKSTNAGSNYSYQSNPLIAPLSSVFFYNSLKGWAVNSLNKAIMMTTDGGTSWQFQSGVTLSYTWVLKQANDFNIGNGFALNPLNKNVLYVCMGKQVYRSSDLGETWQQIAAVNTTFSTAHCMLVNPLDTNKWIIAMSQLAGSVNYRLYSTTDYGSTWTDLLGIIAGSSYGVPLEKDPVHPNTIFFGPDSHSLMKSYDWGVTWITNWGGPTVTNFIFRSPCDLAIDPLDTNIMFCGDGVTDFESGIFWKSTDGGRNFSKIDTVAGSEIPMIANSSLDRSLVYHTSWSSGGFLKSTNSGSNFSQTTGPAANLWAADIAKDDPTAVAYGTYSSQIYLSTNTGASFISTSAVGSNWGAGEYYYDKATLLFQQGHGVYKLNVNYTVPIGVIQISSEVPRSFSLDQNYPNPFNPSTRIRFSLSKSSDVSLKMYDALGSEVKVLASQHYPAGIYETDLDASAMATGVYFYSLVINGERFSTKKMILLK